ncbi:MAG: PhoH family protein [Nanoarchaeota archaeon]
MNEKIVSQYLGDMKLERKYVLEEDVIKAAGDIALKKIGEEGNVVYVDLDKIERESENSQNKSQYAFQDFLKYLNKEGVYDYENKLIHLKSGGKLSWLDPYKSIIEDQNADIQVKHITRSPGTTSRLKRVGKIPEFPQVLIFGTDILEQGLKDVVYNGTNPNNITLDQLLESGFEYDKKGNPINILEENLFNFQYLRLNNNDDLVYRLVFPLVENSRGNRSRIDESRDPELLKMNPNVWDNVIPNFRPKNLRQKLAFKSLSLTDIKVHLLSGGSGGGKTILPIAGAFLHLLGTEKKRQNKELKEGITLFKSTTKIGNDDEGFLPGTTFEKNWPFMKSYKKAYDLLGLNEFTDFDNLLLDPKERKTDAFSKGSGLYFPANQAVIRTPNLMYERGETYENEIVMVDEAQNYTPYQMKQLIERIGENSLLYIIGDYDQVDHPKLSPEFNGLVYAANVLVPNHPRLAMMNFDQNYRSQSAEIMRAHKAPRDY